MQWSDSGVVSANKFLQKIWNLNQTIINLKGNPKSNEQQEKQFTNNINLFAYKITNCIDQFQFNVCIAQFYECYNYFNKEISKEISKEILIQGLETFMRLLIPFVPHIAFECLTFLKTKNPDSWPEIKKDVINFSEIDLVIQINGRKRDLVKFKKDTLEKEITNRILKNSKAKKYLENKKIMKTIYIKNKIINYIVKDH